MTRAPDDDGRAARTDRIRALVATWPPLSDEDLRAIAAVIAPGWVLVDPRAVKPKPRQRKGMTK